MVSGKPTEDSFKMKKVIDYVKCAIWPRRTAVDCWI